MADNEKNRAVSPINGQPVPKGKPFVTGDSRAKDAQKRSTAKKKRQADLQSLMQQWLNGDSGVTDKNGQPLTGAELMVRTAVREMVKGNPKYWELIRDTSGQKPVEKLMLAEIDKRTIAEVEALTREYSLQEGRNNNDSPGGQE